jgi:aspartyl-tRNA(Asn)/glutamyl-tRNA(Gln) amidotransferase subunit A
MFAVMAGYDDEDLYSVRHTWDDVLSQMAGDIVGLRIGIPRRFFFENLEPEIGEAVEQAATQLAALGAVLTEIELDGAESAQHKVMPMVWADAYEYHRDRAEHSPELFGQDVLDRILLGRDISGRDYATALRVREDWNRIIDRALQAVDVILTPTTPLAAPLITSSGDMLETTHHLTRFTYLFSWAGLPGLSVPCGFTTSGLPIGMLLNGRPYDEGLLFRMGSAYQAETNWHQRRPGLLSKGA